jgi:hypothetical protein
MPGALPCRKSAEARSTTARVVRQRLIERIRFIRVKLLPDEMSVSHVQNTLGVSVGVPLRRAEAVAASEYGLHMYCPCTCDVIISYELSFELR